MAGFLPLGYVFNAVLGAWYPLLGVLAVIGAARPDVAKPERTTWLAFALAHLWLHGIPKDLWNRDFIPLTAVLATPAALALARRDTWQASRWPLAILGAGLGFVYAAPVLIVRIAPHAPWIRSGGLPVRIALGVLIALAMAALLAVLARRRVAAIVVPWLAALALVWSAWSLLPWTAIHLDPQFPNYEIERARRERVCTWLRATLPPGPVIGREPAEIELYSGMPALATPYPPLSPTLEHIARRWNARWLVVEPGEVPDSALARMPIRYVGEHEGTRVFGF
jgi:hypothetical protein